MSLRRNVLLAVALSGLGFVSTEHDLRFAPEEGLELRRRISGGIDLNFDRLESTVNGRQVPREYLPDIEMDHIDRWSFEVEDRYGRMGSGRPETLERTYVAAESAHERRFSMSSPMTEPMDESNAWEAESMLEARSVHFQYDDEEGACEPSFPEDDGPDYLLQGLWEDLDWRAFLPEDGDAELGAGLKWKCGERAGRSLLYPGGDLHWEVPEYVDERDMLRGPGEVLGSLSARVVKVDDEAGLCTIEIRGELQTVHEVASNLEHVPVADGTATITTTATYEVEGVLVWNLRDHYAQTMNAEADVRIASVTVKDEGQPGADFDSVFSLQGKWELAAEIERVSKE